MKLYHYDHCPFCIRVRMIIGWKGLQVEEEILANADEQRHYDLIGAKIVPILEKDAEGHMEGCRMKESLDIVAYLDQNPKLLNDSPGDNPLLAQWQDRATQVARYLTHPRNIQVYTRDFPTEKDRNYYENKKSQSIGSFREALAKSPEYIEVMAALLSELEALLPSEEPSYANILLFPALRSLSVVKGLSFPPKVLSYMQQVSSASKVPLMLEQAI